MNARSLTLSALMLLRAAAFAQPGTLDVTFGTGGHVIAGYIPQGTDDARAVALQPDGRILAAGVTGADEQQNFIVARFLANGMPDPDFGDNGHATTSISDGNDIACALAVQPDGRIIAAGYTYRPEGLAFAMVRYLSDGSVDEDFGLNGIVVTSLGDGLTMQALALALQGDHIIAAGGGVGGFTMVRYDNGGDIDATFGTNGLARCSFTNGNDLANGIGFQQDGHIVLSGYASGNTDSIAVARFTANGTLDSGFGTNGRARAAGSGGSAIGRALVIDAQDRIVVAGSAPLNAVVVRFTPEGNLDDTFNGTGVREIVISGADATAAFAVADDGQGHVLVGGRVTQPAQEFLLVRLNTDGTNDGTFDDDGIVSTPFDGHDATAHAMVVQPDGRIILAGVIEFPQADPSFFLLRYLGEDHMGILEGRDHGDFGLAPNPASSTVLLTPEDMQLHTFVLCYDALGRNILSTDTRGGTVLDVSTWPEGAYMVSTTNERGTTLSVRRLLVHH